MDWSLWILLAAVVVFFLWRREKGQEKAAVATERLAKDNRLYQQIKAGKREYEWQERGKKFEAHRDGELLFENAHLKVFHVEHFAESRLGFYFKETDEHGMYGLFVGNEANEIYESYYRSDPTFKEEGQLLHDDI